MGLKSRAPMKFFNKPKHQYIITIIANRMNNDGIAPKQSDLVQLTL